MSTNWTKEQREAIDARGKNLLVSAAAGSGKTAVLVERIISLMIEERVEVGELLIVTFTNAAAGEMKERIQKKLQEKRRELLAGENNGGQKELIGFLTKQIQNIPGANISTLHSFCIDVLKDNFQIANLDPRFRLINESLGAILTANAISNVLESKYAQGKKEFLSLVESYGDSKTDKKLVETVKTMDRFIQAKPNQEQWLREQADFYARMRELKSNNELIDYIFKKPAGALFLQEVEEGLNAVIETLNQGKKLASFYNPPMPAIENLEDDLAQMELIRRKIREEKKPESLESLGAVSFSRYKSPKKADKENFDPFDLEQTKALRDAAKKQFQKMEESTKIIFTDSLLEDMKYISLMVEELVDLVLDYKAEYGRLKQDNALADFSDLEHMTLKVLEDEEVRKSLQDKFKYIFFDEYQDTNLVQETIINQIKRDNNLFFVGDVKQSIYRFRLADPNIFNKRYSDYEGSPISQKIDLSKNFRSRREILDFCNLIFKNIMSPKYGEVDYENEDHQLKSGRDFDAYTDHIELAIIEKSKSEYLLVDKSEEGEEAPRNAEDPKEDADNVTLQAMYVAGKIKELAKTGVQYRDMAILMRSPKGKTKIFEDTLTRFGIPCYIDYKTSNFDSIEIKCLLDYLKIIDNQNQDEALIGAMSSVFGNFDNEELIKIREAFPDYEFYEAAQAYVQLDDSLALKLQGFFGRLSEDIRLERMMGLDDFLWTVTENRGYSAYIGSLDNAEQRLHNIKTFIGKAREYEQSESRGLFGFLRQVDSLLKEKVEDSDSPTILETENVVSLMSIHKSKGLEFKVVFICNMEKRINEMDLRQDVILHNELGIGLRYINSELRVRDNNILLDIIKKQKQIEGISEEIRILYVAMTRAIDRLYLVGSVADVSKFAAKLGKNSIQNNIANQKSFLDWIGNVLIREQKGQVLREYTQIDPSINDTSAHYQLNILREEEIVDMCQEYEREKEASINLIELAEEVLPEETIEKRLTQYLDFEYPFADQTKTRSKISVTELTQAYKNRESYEEADDLALKRPLFIKDIKRFKAHEIGTIIHFLMENIPIQTYDQAVLQEQIDKMTALELLTPEEARVIPLERIISFFDSELGQRMIKSKKVKREASFLMKREDYLVEGVVDCYFEEDGQIVLLDYKTDSIMDKSRHKDQLALYREAVESIEEKNVKETYIYWISHDRFSRL